MNEIYFDGKTWPDTGRKYNKNAQMKVVNHSKKWLDLIWLDESRNEWIYLSTLPKPNE